ncbi:hypothetical protein [Paenibacillus sp. NPDC058071]|uniref:hypothetical protein n=1 Tax=Paenibacillus sp. NPDC058071 TaxID=3346326 RepID=UPI0036DEBEF9
MSNFSPGQQLREAVEAERPLQIAGAINAYATLLAAIEYLKEGGYCHVEFFSRTAA